MSAIHLDLRVSEPAWRAAGNVQTVCQQAVAAGAAVALTDLHGEVAVLLTDDEEMRALNRDWRGKDRATDVLSFPADASDTGFLGDIALGYGVCARDAEAMGLPLAGHLSHLIVHGLLHLAGHDHEGDEDAHIMQALEVKALARLGLHDPYSSDLNDGDD